MNYNYIIPKIGTTRLKLIHNHVTEFLRYNLFNLIFSLYISFCVSDIYLLMADLDS